MIANLIYPEPDRYKFTYGFFKADVNTQVCIDKDVYDQYQGIADSIKEHLGLENVSLDCCGAFKVRMLNEADILKINDLFMSSYTFDEMCKETFIIDVKADSLVAAALGKQGFLYAVKALKQIMTEERALKCSTILYRPYKEKRQVCINLPKKVEYDFFLKVLGEIAELKYNSIIFKNCQSSNLSQEDIESIKYFCDKNMICVQFYDDDRAEDNEADFELDAASVCSWETRTRIEKYIETIGDVKVSYMNEISEEEMRRSGFIFRLVIGAYALNNFDFANSTWEKVLPLAMGRTYTFMENVNCIAMPSQSEYADRYPVLARNNSEDFVTRTTMHIVNFNEQKTVADIEATADSLVLRHTVAVKDPVSLPGEKIGYYTVCYENGEDEQIDLYMDKNISCETAKWNHEFNPVTHNYDTDVRLHRVCCYTKPLLYAKENSQTITLYDFEWINPKPHCAISKVLAAVTDKKYILYVYGADTVSTD
jgi:hypothetical protein